MPKIKKEIIKNIEKEISDVIAQYEHIDKVDKDMMKLFGSNDGEVFNCMWATFDAYLAEWAKARNINYEIISWFIFDNDCGNCRQSIPDYVVNGYPHIIKNIKDIARLIAKIHNDI